MTNFKNFSELADPFYDDEESAARIETYKQESIAEEIEYNLAEIRQFLGITQVQLAEKLELTQPTLSNLERSKDLRLSSLRKILEALGAEIQITAKFSTGEDFPIAV